MSHVLRRLGRTAWVAVGMGKPSLICGGLVCGCLVWGLSSAVGTVWAEPASAPSPSMRRYADGPLTADDFRGAAPENRPKVGRIEMLATTYTDIRYEYRLRTENVGGRNQATMVEVRFHSVVQRDRSWNVRPDDQALMDHEQGHFDLTELYVRRAQARFDPLIAQGRPRGSGADEAAAVQAMLAAFQAELDVVFEEMQAEHKRYDSETRHGSQIDQQRAWNRRFADLLKPAPTKPAARNPSGG